VRGDRLLLSRDRSPLRPSCFLFVMLRRPPRSTRCPYPTLFRSRSLGFSRAVRPAPDASIRRSALSMLRSCRRARRFQARRTSLERKENSSRAAGRRLRGRSRLRRNPGSKRRSFDRLPFRRRRDRADDASRTKRADRPLLEVNLRLRIG